MKVCSVCRRCYEDSALSCTEDNHDVLSAARAGSCEIIPNYRLEALHESAAASETYRALNTILNKPYLIKIVAPAAFDEASKKQFLTEAQALTSLIHPNIARVFESGTLADGSLYVVTEFIAAQTLRECFDHVGKPSEVTALTILRQAAEGLEALHAAGVVHRSIKPENIILTSDAENKFLVKLENMDFGALRQRQVNANGDLFLADLRYFSPEQCAADEADAQTDVYSLGVVLYEALAGKVPFDAAYADALVIKQTRENPPEVKINSFDLRMLVTHTLTDALQKTTRARLKSANALARRLRHIEQLATHSSTPPPAMAYPAAMNKTVAAFTAPAKAAVNAEIEKPLVETTPANVPAAEAEAIAETKAIVENAPAIETAAIVENVPVAEPPQIAEDAVSAETVAAPVFEAVVSDHAPDFAERASLETAPVIEDLPPTAPSIDLEEAPAEAPAIFAAETSSLTESQPPAETAPAIEIPAMKTEPAVGTAPAFVEEIPAGESPARFEQSPAFETEANFETLPSLEAQASAAETPVAEQPPVFETAPSVFETSELTEDSIESAAPIDDSVSAQNEAPGADQILAAGETSAENGFVAENEAIAVNAAEIRTDAAEEFEAEAVHDYSTTKLPPIEKILSDPNFKVTEIEPVFSLRRGNRDIHQTSEPVLVEWEQPDDVPTITAALNISKRHHADVQFAPNADVIDEKPEAPGEADTDEVEYVSEAHKTRRDYASVSSVFTTYEDSGRSWNMPGKRAVITGAAICGLAVLAVGGVFLNRQLQSSDTQQTTAKTEPTSAKTLPKPAETQQNAETIAPAKPENPIAAPVVNAEPELPNYEPRETTVVKTVAPVVQNNTKKRPAVKVSTTAAQTESPSKPQTTEIFDKKGNVKQVPDKKNAAKSQASTSTKNDVFTRPRVVKNPKF